MIHPNTNKIQMRRFSNDEAGSPRVMLVSLKAGGTGITLTSANLVFLLDLWWNFAVEEQAMDRVYRCIVCWCVRARDENLKALQLTQGAFSLSGRIGQTRDVKVVRYVCASSIEERILQVHVCPCQ